MKRFITMLVVSAIAFMACKKEEAPKPPVFNVTSEKTMNFKAAGGNGTITYTIENPSEALSVIAQCEAEWVTDITEGTSVTFTVVANESLEARSTEITVSYGESVQKVSVSQVVSFEEEKRRLETLVKSILPKNYGAIIRTAAEGKNAAVLDAELMSLVEKWEDSWKKLAKSKGVQLLFTEYSKTTTILRDLLNDSFNNIYVNNETIYEEIRKYISLISPEQEKIVKLYKDKAPIFDHFEVTRQIKSSFGKVVPIKQGAYLVIEHTEALHVIDVNSGTRSKNKEQEQNTFDVNCYAAEEIARQLRLRDMGGIVIVDFIDMETNDHKNALYKKMVELMESDRAKHNVLPLTKFGLMQITRQRVRPATEINTTEVCPVCNGTGKISSSVVIDEAIERRLAYYVNEKKLTHLTLKVNPILGSYLTRGIFSSIVGKWKKKYRCKIEVVETTDFTVLQNEFYDEKGGKLD